MISVVVFDLGNVLIPFDYQRLLNKLEERKKGLGERFYELYKKNYHIHREYEKWNLSDEEFLDVMMEWTEYKFTREEFCHIYSDLFEVNHKVAGLLPKLKERYGLVLLSNTNHIHQKYGWEKYDFLKYFDKLILSHEVGAVKPERKIYEAVMNFTKKPADEHLFIDDIEDYARGAINMGWQAIHFKGYDNLLEELKLRNINID